MTTPPHHNRGPRSSHGGAGWFEGDIDLLVQEPVPPAYVPEHPGDVDADSVVPGEREAADEPLQPHAPGSSALGDWGGTGAASPGGEDADRYPGHGIEYAATPGIPGRGVVLLSALAAAGCAVLDFALTGGLTIFFDLCFVVICLVAAMAVRRHDVFAAGVLPPLVFAGVIAMIALTRPTAFISGGDLSKVFLTGLAAHAEALVTGYAVALLTVGGRVVASRKR
ncbi:MAG: hypothetical protein H0U28_06850 [Nocardioidaceae bacterium]|nr:hypothetical protein [Nocardioidaceae bacterium]